MALRRTDLASTEVGGRSEDNTLERAVGHSHGETGRVREPLGKARKQRSSSGDQEAASVELRGEVGWATVKHVADGREDLGKRSIHRHSDVATAYSDRSWQA